MKKWMTLIIWLTLAGTVNALEIGPEIFSHKYEEFSSGGTFMKETGTFYGIVLNSDNHGFEGELAYGTVDYDGQLLGGTPYEMSDIKDWLVDVRFLGGDIVYIGVGYRYLRDDSSPDPAGYLRQSNYLYWPIGLRLKSNEKKGWTIGGSAEFDFLVAGLQLSDLSNLGLGTVANVQGFGEGYGARGAIRLENKNFRIEPFVRYWHISKSSIDADTGFFEPENETTQYGVQLIWIF